ncbi:phage tail protein [Micromonospora sp. NPDC048063]|uniref:phage tail protein n=1 Tax=Micromonospora sp. NPDC048063 TaxID=3364256 RepID=UPI00372338D5
MNVPIGALAGEANRTTERLLALLPDHLRGLDEQGGGVLRALLSAVAVDLDVLEGDLTDLYDDWFAETCTDRTLPHLADLVGLAEPLPAGPGVDGNRRALVANAVARHRRKGTLTVLEQVARDATGWPAVAVEYFRLLTTTAHLVNARPERPAVASLRDAARLDLVGARHDLRRDRTPPAPELIDPTGGALDPLPRTPQVRNTADGRGRHGLARVGVFLFPLRTYGVGPAEPAGGGSGDPDRSTHPSLWSQARLVGDEYRIDPLGRRTPLFAAPPAGDGTEHLTREEHLPVPLRPRRLLAMLAAARGGTGARETLPIGVRVGRTGDPLPPERLRVAGLEELAPVAGTQVSVDAVEGRLRVYRDGQATAPDEVFVRYHYGSLADIGAGTYERSDVHARVLAADPYRGRREVAGQVTVRSDAAASVLAVPSVTDALARAEQAWSTDAGQAMGATYVVSVGDNASYLGDLDVRIPAATRLILVAAAWPDSGRSEGVPHPTPGVYVPDGLRPHLRGGLRVTGGAGSSLVLDGFLVEGDVTVAPGALTALTVSQCTLTGRLTVADDPAGGHRDLRVSLVRSVVGSVRLAPVVPLLAVSECVTDAADTGEGVALAAEGAHLSAEGSTIRGTVSVRSVDAGNCLFDGRLTAEHRQVGCLRYCYAGPGSRGPQRFRCHPPDDTGTAGPPVYAVQDPGSPMYLALARDCPAALTEGGEDGSEMGVHHHLGRPLRRAAARRHLAPHAPAGLDLGVFGS